MNATIRRRLRNCKRRIQRRLRKKQWTEQRQRMFRDQNIHYEIGDKARAVPWGGLGAIHLLVQRLKLAEALDRGLHLLTRHLPYFESDHILNLAYNLIAGGKVINDLELLRTNETYLNALGAQRIPDPTTAGDFLRRFRADDIMRLMRLINQTRLTIWKQQPPEFFERAVLEADGTLVETTGECKQGMDLSYNGVWGYHPLLVSLANTQEPLILVNRPASRPSHEGAAPAIDQAIALCRQAGFRAISLRGDTDFPQTTELDRWDDAGVHFVFGIDAMANLVEIAGGLPAEAWQELRRPAPYEVATKPRRRPEDIKQHVVLRKGYTDIRLVSEQVASFRYRPGACRKDYRVVVLRKRLSIEKHGQQIREELRYFFWITNEWGWSEAGVVTFANDRGNQENLIAQLKDGVPALRAPVNTLEANWAYMVIASLAWTLKVWFALLQPRGAVRQDLLRMEFKKFLQEVVLLPSQIVFAGRRLIYRFLSWNPWVNIVMHSVELIDRLRVP